MTVMALRALATMILVAAVFLPMACGGGERVLRTRDRQIISFDRMLDEIRGARVIFVGESHVVMAHHRTQLRIIRALERQGVSLAVGMEMFPAVEQPSLDRWLAQRMSGEEFIDLYYRNWRMPWPLYRDILLYARRQGIPIVGLNIPRDVAEKVARQGFAALTPAERKMLPPDITCDVDSRYMAFIKEAYSFHAAGGASFLHFCEAQLIWNRGMATHVAFFLASQPQRSMVVICGAGHALKRGIPAELARESRAEWRVILPELPELPRERVTAEDADYLLLGG